MAEARSAVGFETLAVGRPRRSSTGAPVTDRVIANAVYERPRTKTELTVRFAGAVARTSKRGYMRVRNTVVKLFFPTTPLSWYVSVGSIAAARHFRIFGGGLQRTVLSLDNHLPYIRAWVDPLARAVGSSLVIGTAVWVTGAYLSAKTLKALLRYKGFLNDSRSAGFLTKAWGVALTVYKGFGKPMTHSFDSFLPALPVPALHATVTRYLLSMRPLLNTPEYERLERLAREFEDGGQGSWLQFLLHVKHAFVPNYVTDWWERFVYLRWREPMAINSNYYIMDARDWRPTNNQLARAANLVHQMLRFSTLVAREELPPVLVAGAVPLCMQQYRRIFGTTRVPLPEEDRLVTCAAPRHVAVLCRGHWFALPGYDDAGARLSACDLEAQLKKVVALAAAAGPAALASPLGSRVAVLTGGDRDVWAEARALLMRDRHSAASIECIERAAFVLCLDEDAPEVGPADASAPCPVAHALLHGAGANRWFDKSFNLVVFANGRAGLTVEHSWADAPVPAHVLEWCLGEEFLGPGYDSENGGANKVFPQPKRGAAPPPTLLKWGDAPPAIAAALDDGFARADAQVQDLDLRIYKHAQYSKGLMKRFGLSPDAYIQMALQLAYYRDRGEFCQTYEASMTRLFALGRTETVRSCTLASCAFVRAMEDAAVPPRERERLLRTAVDGHVALYRAAMSGEGVDRHLFALYVAAVGYYGADKVPEFLRQVKAVPWSLSTSQTPAQQTTHWDLKANPNKVTGGGGFGPVSADGYGVSYIVASDDVLLLHVSSKRASPLTDSRRFCERIVQALADMRVLLEANAAAAAAAARTSAAAAPENKA